MSAPRIETPKLESKGFLAEVANTSLGGIEDIGTGLGQVASGNVETGVQNVFGGYVTAIAPVYTMGVNSVGGAITPEQRARNNAAQEQRNKDTANKINAQSAADARAADAAKEADRIKKITEMTKALREQRKRSPGSSQTVLTTGVSEGPVKPSTLLTVK